MATKARPPERPTGGPAARLAAAVAMVVMIAMIVYVVWYARSSGHDPTPRVFDPTTTNAEELRRVTEAVSRIIAASPDSHELAVQTLEAVRADSPGARDLKDSCVNTYRPTIRAQVMLRELTGLVGAPDGGELRADQIAPDARLRAIELQRQLEAQIDLADQSKDRCMNLYIEATRAMGIAPARRYETHVQ